MVVVVSRHKWIHHNTNKIKNKNATPKKKIPVGTCIITVMEDGIGEAAYWEHTDWKDGGIQPNGDIPASSTSTTTDMSNNVAQFLNVGDWTAMDNVVSNYQNTSWIAVPTVNIGTAVRTYYPVTIESTGVFARKLYSVYGAYRKNWVYYLINLYGLKCMRTLEVSRTAGVHTEEVAEYGGATNNDGTPALRHKGYQIYNSYVKYTLTISKP